MPPKPRATKRTTKPTSKKSTPGVLQLDRPENEARIAELIADREPFFSVDGVEYTIPKQPPPSWGMEAFHVASTQGYGEAMAFALYKLIGDEGYAALSRCKTLTPEDIQTLSRAAVERVLPGGVPGPKASESTGTTG